MRKQYRTHVGISVAVALALVAGPATAQVMGQSQSTVLSGSSTAQNGGVYVNRMPVDPFRTVPKQAPVSTATSGGRQFVAAPWRPSPAVSYPARPVQGPVYPAPWSGPDIGLPNPYAPPWNFSTGMLVPSGAMAYGAFAPEESQIVTPGYYFPGYCAGGYGSDAYPSVYGEYIGMPSYMYSPGDIVFGSGDPTVFDPSDGQSYDYSYDTSSSTGGFDDNSDSGAVTPDATMSLDAIAQSWAHQNMGSFSQYVPDNGPISVGQNGQYAYSVSPQAYQLMTHDAISRIGTTDFHYTSIRVQPNGRITGYGVQQYRAPTGGQWTMYVAYTLRRDTSAPHGYTIAAMQTSSRPLAPSTRRNVGS